MVNATVKEDLKENCVMRKLAPLTAPQEEHAMQENAYVIKDLWVTGVSTIIAQLTAITMENATKENASAIQASSGIIVKIKHVPTIVLEMENV